MIPAWTRCGAQAIIPRRTLAEGNASDLHVNKFEYHLTEEGE